MTSIEGYSLDFKHLLQHGIPFTFVVGRDDGVTVNETENDDDDREDGAEHLTTVNLRYERTETNGDSFYNAIYKFMLLKKVSGRPKDLQQLK